MLTLGDDSASFWAAVENGGPALIGVVVVSVLLFVFLKYLILPAAQTLTTQISQIAADFRIASENHRIAQEAHRQALVTLKEHEAMFGSKLRQAEELVEDAKEWLEPFKPKSGTHQPQH